MDIESCVIKLIHKTKISPRLLRIIGAWVERILYAICFYRLILYTCDFMNQNYETLKNIYMAKLTVWFVILLMIIRKVRVLNFWSLLFSLIYYPLAKLVYMSNLYGADIEAANLSYCIAVWLFGLLFIDLIRRRNTTRLEEWNLPGVLLFLATGVALSFCRNGRMFPLFFVGAVPFLFFIRIRKITWDRVLKGMADGFTVAFFVMMYSCLKEVPYTGGRYWGTFVQLAYFGEFLGTIFAVLLYRIYEVKKKYGRKSFFYWLNLVILVLVFISINMTGVRAAYLGLAILLVLCYVLLRKDISVKQVFKRILLLFGIFVVFAVLGITVMSMLKGIDKHSLDPNMFMYEKVKYIVGRSNEFFNAKTFENCEVFPEGSLINAIDWFTSGRISIAVVYARMFTLSGNVSQYVQVGDYLATSVHNSYVQYLFDYGYVGGGLFIWLFFYSFYRYATIYRKKKYSYLLCGLFSIGMASGILLCETQTFGFPNIFFWFLMLYPVVTNTLLLEKKENTEKKTKKGQHRNTEQGNVLKPAKSERAQNPDEVMKQD